MNAMLLSFLLREFLVSIPTVLFYGLFGAIRTKCSIRFWRVVACVFINTGIHAVTRFFLASQPISYVITLLEILLCTRILWANVRGTNYWFTFFFSLIAEVAIEVPTMLAFMAICPDAMRQRMLYGHEVTIFRLSTLPLLFLVSMFIMVVPLVLMLYLRKSNVQAPRPDAAWIHLLRFALVMAIMIALLVFYGHVTDSLVLARMKDTNALKALIEHLPLIAVFLLAAILLGFYGWQDMRQYRLLRRNQNLIEQNEAYQRVLTSTREFRHNIANMLYGLEGVILTGEVDEIQKYYSEMAKRCMLINNDNAVALNRVADASLMALLLHKLDAAREKGVPFYLTVDSGFKFVGLPSHTLCEIMGNLLDNSLEAAEKAEAPEVHLTLRSTHEYSEILLSNTCSSNADLSFLTTTPVSSKPNHRATGLTSVKRLLSHHKNVHLNQYQQSRFIETSLVCVGSADGQLLPR